MTKTTNLFLARIFATVAICLAAGFSSYAASLTVTTTADGGPGSLRQAIADATTNTEANTVAFDIPVSDPGYDVLQNRFTISLATALPPLPPTPIDFDNTQPYGITVSANNNFRVFLLPNSAVVTINNLTISNGNAAAPRPVRAPFGRLMGTISDGYGGGIYMGDSSTLNLNGSQVINNTAAVNGGGIYMRNSAIVNMNTSTMSGNSAIDGGAIYINNSGTLNINTSTVNANSALGSGGGVYNNTSGTINATTNTIDGNTAAGSGGGVYNTATITFTNNTITSNIAALGGGIYNNFTATMLNNLIALNTAADGPDLLGRDSLGQAFTGVYNMIGNADGSEGISAAPNRAGTTLNPIDPILGPLQNNGGPTHTRALLVGSPAIDKGDSATIVLDQRGQVRPNDNLTIPNDGGNGADMGSLEAARTTAAPASISGRVMTANGSPIRNAQLVLTGNGLAAPLRVRTSSFGYYTFDGLEIGETYLLTINSKSFTFGSASRVVHLMDNIADLDFTADPAE